MGGSRLGAIRVSAELMFSLFRTSEPGQWWQVREGLPPDAEFVRQYHDDVRNEFVFIYTHPSFPLALPGHPVTFLNPPHLHAITGVRYDTAAHQLVVLDTPGSSVRVAKTREEFEESDGRTVKWNKEQSAYLRAKLAAVCAPIAWDADTPAIVEAK